MLQRLAPGTHTPLHPVGAQRNEQTNGSSHSPLLLQLMNWLLSHLPVLGLHAPTQPPSAQRKGQVFAFSQTPLVPQLSTSAPMHVLALGVVHIPPSSLGTSAIMLASSGVPASSG